MRAVQFADLHLCRGERPFERDREQSVDLEQRETPQVSRSLSSRGKCGARTNEVDDLEDRYIDDEFDEDVRSWRRPVRLPPLRELSQSSTIISSLAPSICDVHDPVRSEAATDKVPEVFAIHEAPQSSPGYVCGRGEWGVRIEAAMDE